MPSTALLPHLGYPESSLPVARHASEHKRRTRESALAPRQTGDGMSRAQLHPAIPDGFAQRPQKQRPAAQARTSSAPLLSSGRPVVSHGGHLKPARSTAGSGTNRHEPKDHGVSGVTGAMRSFQPFESPEAPDALAEINIAVVGAARVDKSSFVAKALGLPQLARSRIAERKISHKRRIYLVRLLVVAVEDVEIDDDDEIGWPATTNHQHMPRIDGALALYDVRDKGSIEQMSDMLNAISKEALPTILVSCRCETPSAEREVEPSRIEEHLKRANIDIHTLRISDANPDSYKRTLPMILEAIVGNSFESLHHAPTNRPRAKSTAVRAVSPRPPGTANHSRASSEFTGSLYKERTYGKQEQSSPDSSLDKRLREKRQQPQEQMYGSFLLEESASDRSLGSARSSLSTDGDVRTSDDAAGVVETGVTFDDLADRLLAQPASKADVKFSAIFLALYRGFAAPSQLLQAIVERFESLERRVAPQMTKTMHQLRYVFILEQWIAAYPGDFAYPRTKYQLQTFVAKLADTRIFSVAAKEISSDLEAVHEDDDTNWAICDRNRESFAELDHDSGLSTATTLVDDPSFLTGQELDYSTIHKQFATPDHVSATMSNSMLLNVEAAQRQAALLQPIPRYPITKLQWRILMDIPDEVIATELTRIDWIMLSAIRPRDLVRDCSLSKEQKADFRNVAHVTRMSDHFNTLAAWVVNYILLRDKPKHRAMILEKFMRVARKLREMNNYNSLGAIIAGVKSTPVHRLNATRELISPSLGRDWLKLEILMAPSRSHAAYRLAWENSTSERIPYLPLHRRDLSTAEQGNKTWVGDERDGRINWKKFEIIGDVIVGIQRAQDAGYKSLASSRGSDQVRELVLDAKLIREEEELWELSIQCEPVAMGDRGNATSTSGKLKDLFKRSMFDSSRTS